MSMSEREERALRRWTPPGDTRFNRFLTNSVVSLSRGIMRGLNSLSVENAGAYSALIERRERGLLTFSNHVSLFDDPLLLANLELPAYGGIRWVGADAINFFGSGWKAFIFRAGKCVPIVRGAGFDQPGFYFLRDRLNEGAWVHIFPEGGRTRDPQALLTAPFKPGIGRLMVETRPIALPFYHYGMHEVLPVGTKTPRARKKVRILFGEPVDCDALISELDRNDGGALSGPRLWEALTAACEESLRALQAELNPAATVTAEPEEARV
ncbi:MAG: lysophospholipid acyltransferase family protein [bacterium]